MSDGTLRITAEMTRERLAEIIEEMDPAAGPWTPASEPPEKPGPFLVMATNSWGETWAWTALWESQRWRADDEDHTPLLKVTHYAIIKPPKP